jgi:ribosomal protein S18 acetylase RimI-like enzyme
VQELYVAAENEERVGFVLVDMRGAFAGYVQSLCVAPRFQNCSYGTTLLRFAENRILTERPNDFLCVSSFNSDALRFYCVTDTRKSAIYRTFIIAGASEILLVRVNQIS